MLEAYRQPIVDPSKDDSWFADVRKSFENALTAQFSGAGLQFLQDQQRREIFPSFIGDPWMQGIICIGETVTGGVEVREGRRTIRYLRKGNYSTGATFIRIRNESGSEDSDRLLETQVLFDDISPVYDWACSGMDGKGAGVMKYHRTSDRGDFDSTRLISGKEERKIDGIKKAVMVIIAESVFEEAEKQGIELDRYFSDYLYINP